MSADDPAQMFQMLSRVDLLIETIDEIAVVSGGNEVSGYDLNVVGCIGDTAASVVQSHNPIKVSEAIDDVFLPAQIENRSTNKKKTLKKTSQSILTSEETLRQKRQLQIKKYAKAVFLPAQTENRSTNKKKTLKKTSQSILTSEETLQQKRQLQIKKYAKAA